MWLRRDQATPDDKSEQQARKKKQPFSTGRNPDSSAIPRKLKSVRLDRQVTGSFLDGRGKALTKQHHRSRFARRLCHKLVAFSLGVLPGMRKEATRIRAGTRFDHLILANPSFRGESRANIIAGRPAASAMGQKQRRSARQC